MANIIFTKEPADTIHIDDINVEKHIIVAKDHRDKGRAILTREKYNQGNFYFLCLDQSVTNGNSYPKYKIITECILNMSINGEVQAFETVKEAFKWLFDE